MKTIIPLLASLMIILLIGNIYYNLGYKEALKITPSAMDVYQGKTILQYTVIDGIKTDSIVIYKKIINEKNK